MCGIAGMAGTASEPLLREMLQRIRHRGPDDSGTYTNNGASAETRVAIGNNRLSIIDLSPAGHQPMSNEDGTIWVAYNGEVFNFQELRTELEQDGHQFRSRTDTEVLVHLYEKHGPDMVKRLNGMFAFAVWDSKRKQLWVFRDRMGIKPLYYTQVRGKLYFASEIKALLACPEIGIELDLNGLYQYLACLYVPNPATLFKGIAKLPPGFSLCWEKGQIQIEPFWEMKAGDYLPEPETDLVERLREALMSATRRQLISDVPVGFFLSGGLDSSTLVACAARQNSSALRCYSIAYQQQDGSLEQSNEDAQFANLVASHFGANFREIQVDPQVATLLPKVVYHLDNPVADPAAIATYLICRAARPEVTVLLSGQGADEIFGGYRVHRVQQMTKWLRFLPHLMREEIGLRLLRRMQAYKNYFPAVSPGLVLAFCRFAERLIRTADLGPQEQYAAVRTYQSDVELEDILSPEVRREIPGMSCWEPFTRHFAEAAEQDFVDQMLYVDAKTFLPDLNLAYSDKLSMACSLEVRVPFLDNEVVDLLLRIPPELKIKGSTQKYILRQAMKGILPDSVLRRRKAGFGLPVRSWLKGDLSEMLGDLLSEQRLRRRGLFNANAVAKMIRDNDEGRRDYTFQLWGLLSLELWHELFADGTRSVSQDKAAVC